MFPDRVKRLVFTLHRDYEPNQNLLEQIIENPSMEKGMAEVAITDIATNWLGNGTYNWSIFALANDGARDTWLPYSEGKIQIADEVGDGKDIEILP